MTFHSSLTLHVWVGGLSNKIFHGILTLHVWVGDSVI